MQCFLQSLRRRRLYGATFGVHRSTAPYPQNTGIYGSKLLESFDPLYHSRDSVSFSSHSGSKERTDPFARRPTSKCDPYGQSGKPLTFDEASRLMKTVEPEWKLMMWDGDSGDEHDSIENETGKSDGSVDGDFVPYGISRVFWHEDYMLGAKFCTHVAAVAQMNAQHFPHEVILHRKLHRRNWGIFTQIGTLL